MSFQSLNLDQDAIPEAVHAYARENGATADGPVSKQNYDEYQLTVRDEKVAALHVYKKIDGSTTLNPKVGKNQPRSEKLAKYIVEKTNRLPGIENRPLTLADFQEETWNLLREYLESVGCKITDEALNHGRRIRVIGPQRDQVYLHRYDSGKFMMQGRCMDVYNTVTSFLCEVHQDKRAVLVAQLEVVPVHTTVDALNAELRQHLPKAAGYLGEVGCAILAPAIAQTKIAVELPDYSLVAFPALKGLEFYMKKLLVDKGQAVPPAQGLGAFFTSQGAVVSGCVARIGCPLTVDALEKSYAIHSKHRNSLFHADGEAPDMTRIIEQKSDAADIVYDVLRTIEFTYSAIAQQ